MEIVVIRGSHEKRCRLSPKKRAILECLLDGPFDAVRVVASHPATERPAFQALFDELFELDPAGRTLKSAFREQLARALARPALYRLIEAAGGECVGVHSIGPASPWRRRFCAWIMQRYAGAVEEGQTTGGRCYKGIKCKKI